MKKIIAILVLFICSVPAFAYEANKVQKINDVNSYQPVKFSKANHKKDKKPELINVESLDKYENFHIDAATSEEVTTTDDSKIEMETKIKVDELKTTVDKDEKAEVAPIKSGVGKTKIEAKVSNWSKFMEWGKGVPADDGLNLTLNSYHTSSKRDQYNESHDLIAMQYNGYSFGYFENSHHRTSLFLCWARKVWQGPSWKGFSIDLQHKTGLLTGYRDHAPNIANISPIIMPIIGLNYKKVSADIWITPNIIKPIFSVAMRIGFPDSWCSNYKCEKKIEHKELTNVQLDTKIETKKSTINDYDSELRSDFDL